MDVNRSTLEGAFNDIVTSAAYRSPWPIGPNSQDKQKVARRLAGQPATSPSHRLARAAWRLAGALFPLTPTPPPPPPPPPRRVAPRTYNTVPGGSDARFCTAGLPRNPATGHLFDDFSEYDDDGRDLGGRTQTQVPGLRQANDMNGMGPCDPYGPFPPWPTASYDR